MGCILAVVMVLSWLTGVLTVDSCFDTFQCFDQLYSECNGTINEQQQLAISITVRQNSTFEEDRFSQVLSELVCHYLNASIPSLCWHLELIATANESSTDYNSTLAQVGVLEISGGGILKPALTRQTLGNLLQSSVSFFVLAGFCVTVIEAPASDDSNRLFDVPVTSWICVGLGLLFSFILLTKPVWWDNIISRCWHKCRQ